MVDARRYTSTSYIFTEDMAGAFVHPGHSNSLSLAFSNFRVGYRLSVPTARQPMCVRGVTNENTFIAKKEDKYFDAG